ncbi:acyltransferase [Nocardioides daphniae]|uniref:Sugar acetyltransferase n=1 Tax=Nocardioides daphniae TaxID=402297 RepID=A0ABQ1QFA5_9ACTN|nr:acyltransferase [Nocardioides daphniae]GGD25140.1 sugar acetyltransferase [Nocardioides daphniae]
MKRRHRLIADALHRVHGWVERAGAIAPGTALGDEFGTLAPGSCIAFPPMSLFGTRSMHVGAGTMIGRQCSLGVGYGPDDASAPERGLVIGERCVVGARATITAHESIVIGDDVWFGQDVYISDANHGYQDPHTPIGLQFGKHDPVEIGDGSWIGRGAVILPGSRIGRNVVVGAGSVVRGVVPDHSVVVGVPARVVRRLEPGIGWVSTTRPGDVLPAVSTDEVARALGLFLVAEGRQLGEPEPAAS